MPRENSFSDSDGRSLTPDLEEELAAGTSPTYGNGYTNAMPNIPTSIGESTATRQRPGLNPLSPTGRSSYTRTGTGLTSPMTQRSMYNRSVSVNGWSALPPREKFRAAVRKVMVMNRGSRFFSTSGGGRIGGEPGINPRRASAEIAYGHIRQDCIIEVVDYSSVRSSAGRMTNREFIAMMDDQRASAREPWAKVRWINIGGMSWDVIKAVSLRYDLHPLALEDIFHTRSQNRSKADYYSKHLFMRILCHQLGPEEEINNINSHSVQNTFPEFTRSESPEPLDEQEEDALTSEKPEPTPYCEKHAAVASPSESEKKRRFLPLNAQKENDLEAMLGSDKDGSVVTTDSTKQRVNEATLDALKQGERVNVKVSPMYLFLLRDGTVISIHTTPNLDFTNMISQRLRQRDTLLRSSADPSILVHAILDLIVDNALEVIDEYHKKINKLERAILLRPQMKTVRALHILSGDLTMHKRTLEPIRTLIYGLRRYDVDRCAALVDLSDPKNKDVKVVGFMSHKSKIYLADVFDHMEYILSSLDMFASIAENLINYTFNLASYDMNETMRRLTLATIIFLPLTLLTGYFGMNFEHMWSVNYHSDLLFWEIAIPVMIVVIGLFLVPDFKRMAHYIQKKMLTKGVKKTLKAKIQ